MSFIFLTDKWRMIIDDIAELVAQPCNSIALLVLTCK